MTEQGAARNENAASVIEHVLLSPALNESETLAGCSLARVYRVGAVNVKPCFVRQSVSALKGTGIAVSTVIGFPHGSNSTVVKMAETKRALTEGATEIEMVINLGYLLSEEDDLVLNDIRCVCGLAHMNGATVKVNLEAGLLAEPQIIKAAKIAVKAGADWLSTSTGFAEKNAYLDEISILRRAVGESVNIKALGGINSLSEFLAVRNAGCSRVGTSSSAAILRELNNPSRSLNRKSET